MDQLRTDYQQKVRTARASALLPKLVDQLFISPAITTSRAAQLLGVQFSSAQKSIDKLLKAGILTELTGQKRHRIYFARSLLKAIEGQSRLNQKTR